MGHMKNYSVGDAVAHFHRRTGHRVLHPMGYDAFGLPAENHAIRTGEHPRDSTAKSIAPVPASRCASGASRSTGRASSRRHEPRYYRWTQWLFLRLFERGLAYRKEAAVNWCPVDATVLANEQVIDGRCERCGSPVEMRQLEQWFFRITDYADRLLDDLATIEWPEHVVTMQRNWIGRSEGAEVTFTCDGAGHRLRGLHDAPGHAVRRDVLRHGARAPRRAAAGRGHGARGGGARVRQPRADREPRGARRRRPREDRRVPRPPRRQPGQRRADPDVGRRLRADGVRHRRDHGRARPRRARLRVRDAGTGWRSAASSAAGRSCPYAGDGPIVNSDPRFDGMQNREALDAIVDWLDREGRGHRSVNYRLRDWLLSRQRYWGCPIPIVHCDACGLVPVPDDQLPVLLPDVTDYKPKGRSPLADRGGLGQHDLPALRRARAARDGHDGHVRRLVLVLPALLRRRQRRGAVGPRGARALGAGRPVHRRRRARDPAPAVRALLRQGARRHGAARRAGAVPAASSRRG